MKTYTQEEVDNLCMYWSSLGADRERERIIELIGNYVIGDATDQLIELIEGSLFIGEQDDN